MQGHGWTRRRRAAAWAALLGVTCALAHAERAAAAGDWRWPVSGPVLTRYSNDNGRPYAGGMHRGIDIGAAVGTRVGAATGGAVTYAGALGSSGLVVAVRSRGGGTVATYLHLGAIAVRRGQAVEAGDRLGAVGTTGRRSIAAPHLHFGVHSAEHPDFYYDPLDFLAPPAARTPRADPPPAVAPAPVRAAAPVGVGSGAPAGQPAGAPRPAGARAGEDERALPGRTPFPARAPVPAGARAGFQGRGPAPARQPAPVPAVPRAGDAPRPAGMPAALLALPLAAILVLLAILGPGAPRLAARFGTPGWRAGFWRVRLAATGTRRPGCAPVQTQTEGTP